MEQGPTEAEIIRQCKQHKMPLPDAILNAPTLQPGLELYLSAFMDLNTTRQIGMAEGPIPWNYVKDWGIYNKLDDEQMHALFYHIRAMDDKYLSYKSKKAKQK